MNTETGELYKKIRDHGNMWEDESGHQFLRDNTGAEIVEITSEEFDALKDVPQGKRPQMLRELRNFAKMKERRREKVRNDPRTAIRNEAQGRGKKAAKRKRQRRREARRNRKRNR